MRRYTVARSAGFSLVELLVVIGIIAILLGIFLPALSAARARANELQCLTNLRNMWTAASIHVNEHGGYLPVCGLHWDPKGGVVDPEGVGDKNQIRYVYYEDAGTRRPAPITVALGHYLGVDVHLDSRDAMARDMEREPLRRRFRCPSQPEQLKGLSQKEEGGWDAPREYSSYIFNEAVLGKRDKTYETPIGKLVKVKSPASVFFVMDGRPRSETDDWLTVFDYGPNDTLEDFNRQIQEGDLGKQSLDLLRHRGRANVLFLDGHAQSVPLTPGGQREIGVSRGIY